MGRENIPSETTNCPGLHVLSIERRGGGGMEESGREEGALAQAMFFKQCAGH